MFYYSFLLKNIVLPFADRAMKTSVSKMIKKIREMNNLSREEIQYWQLMNLKKLIYHAYEHTKYYRDLFDNNKLKPSDIKIISDLQKIPILTKNQVRMHFNDLIPDNVHECPYHNSSTGGSSGDPITILLDNRSWSFTTANSIFNWEKSGYKYGDKHIALGSTSLFVENKTSFKHRLFYSLKRKIGLNGINMSEKTCKEYIDLINTKEIKYIYGYASAIYLLANYVIKYNVILRIRVCFTTSEILTNEYRYTIQKAFNCKIIDCYGARDGGITAFSHKENCYEVGYNSIIRQSEDNHNLTGPILLTDLLNYAMPMINYQLGDEVEINPSLNIGYPYNGQIINRVLGRQTDIIFLKNGRILTGPGFTILFKDLPVEYYYIEKIDINSIKCSIKKLDGYTIEHEQTIKSTFKKQAGEDVQLIIVYNDTINYTPSGKRKFIGDKDFKK